MSRISNPPLLSVAYVGPFPPHRGGIAQHGARIVESLRALGHDVAVYSWLRQYPAFLYPGDQADVSDAAGASFTLRWWNPLGWWRVGRRLRSVDLIVMPWVTPFHGPALWMIRRVARVPVVAIVHNSRPHESHLLDRPLTRLGLTGIDGAVAHSRRVADDLREWLPTLVCDVTPHPSNLNTSSPRAAPLPPPPLRLLSPGYVRPYKGVEIGIAGVALARRAGIDVRLTVAGEVWSPSLAQLESLIADSGLTEVVDVRPGYLPDAGLLDLIASHHALLLPYRDATQSGLVPLAFAVGRPVVVTDVGGLREQVRPGLDATISPPDDPTALADAIIELARSYATLQAGAVQSATASWTRAAEAVLAASRPSRAF